MNGLVYHQIDISSKPVVEVLTKDVKQTEETTVASRNDVVVLKKLGATKQYTDEEGYQATLKAEKGSINYTVSGYTTKNQTKHGSRTYYNLSSMDFSQIPKSIWEGGVYLTLMDVKWIGDNNLASGDTAVGNTYAAVGYYTGTYSVKIPSGYRASVLYKGYCKEGNFRADSIYHYLPRRRVDATAGGETAVRLHHWRYRACIGGDWNGYLSVPSR